ncbi:putative acetyltransferase [Clostridium puniceum]|uniref:Putative acetyltransferase n=1 Tax=Clostridium puniceum TaxID=29367 RepID=A0A1S8TTE0_9CLOT|nr:putative acetyltransferase [Clostridium puniceum]
MKYCKLKYPYLILDVFIKNEKAVNFYYNNNFKALNEHVSQEAKEKEYLTSWSLEETKL